MTQQPCMWCGQTEPCEHYNPPKDTEYLCSRCTMMLTSFTQDQIKALRAKLVDKELQRLIDILDNFTGGEHATGNTRDTEKRADRTRTVRSVKVDKTTSGRSEKKKGSSIRKVIGSRETVFRTRPDRFL